jgi:hypothetical protein
MACCQIFARSSKGSFGKGSKVVSVVGVGMFMFCRCRVDETEPEKLWLDEAFKTKYSKSAFTLKQLMIALDRLD